jgi:hypothetical protein
MKSIHQEEDVKKDIITPQNLPVGVIASMVKDQISRNKENKLPYIPYQMLEIENTPQIKINELPNENALTKIETFYKFYRGIK